MSADHGIFEPASERDVTRLVLDHPFAWLVTSADGEFAATPLPLRPVVDEPGRSHGAARSLRAAQPARRAGASRAAHAGAVHWARTATFRPSWLTDRTRTPTWNYASAQYVVDIEFTEEPAATDAVVRDLVDAMEAGRPRTRGRCGDWGRATSGCVTGIIAFRAHIARAPREVQARPGRARQRVRRNRQRAVRVGEQHAARVDGRGNPGRRWDVVASRAGAWPGADDALARRSRSRARPRASIARTVATGFFAPMPAPDASMAASQARSQVPPAARRSFVVALLAAGCVLTADAARPPKRTVPPEPRQMRDFARAAVPEHLSAAAAPRHADPWCDGPRRRGPPARRRGRAAARRAWSPRSATASPRPDGALTIDGRGPLGHARHHRPAFAPRRFPDAVHRRGPAAHRRQRGLATRTPRRSGRSTRSTCRTRVSRARSPVA